MIKEYDVIVVGGGHAGCEAALACARKALKTVMICINLDSIALMPCNPNIGGSSKGHLVKEIDALGGEMGKNIDKTFIQTRMLNTAKGPAVHSLRAQADKYEYAREMRRTLEMEEHLDLRQNEVVDILVEYNEQLGLREVTGVVTETNITYKAKCVILCTGTYLKSKCLCGEVSVNSGPNGMKSSDYLSESLRKLEINMLRFKTGTPARIDRKSIDFSEMEEQKGDEEIVPFSFSNAQEQLRREQISCHLTYTNENTHEVIKKGLHRSPMYSGKIEGVGTRYCPSIEDKIVRFADKERHQVFIEPEGKDTNEMYISGMSTSLPEDVQEEMYRTVKGLENCKIVRNGYAIEYDCIDATALKLTLEFKQIHGLFSAGQFNGSSGYEEAAAQGLIAGINAALKIEEKEELVIDRSQGYIGVLIDDLVTKGTKEPYRMMTSRAEYRLLLRQDNADIRLTKKGYEIGLVSDDRYRKFEEKQEMIKRELKRVASCVVSPKEEVNSLLEALNSNKIETGITLKELIKRPELSYDMLKEIDAEREVLPKEVAEQVNIQIKYDGYIKRQMQQVEQFKKLEKRKLSDQIKYSDIKGLRLEARQKLDEIKPENVGHATRITGVSPADISVLLVHLEQMKRLSID